MPNLRRFGPRLKQHWPNEKHGQNPPAPSYGPCNERESVRDRRNDLDTVLAIRIGKDNLWWAGAFFPAS